MKIKPLRRYPLVQFFLLSVRSVVRERAIIFWSFLFPLGVTLLFVTAFSNEKAGEALLVAISQPEQLSPAWLKVLNEENSLRILATLPIEKKDLPASDSDVTISSVSQLSLPLQELFLHKKADVLITPEKIYSIRTSEQFKAQLNILLATRAKALGESFQTVHLNVPGVRFSDWFIPGMLGLTLLSSGLFGVAMKIVSDREMGFLRRLRLGPFPRSHYILGFALGRGAFVLIQVLLLTLLFRITFGFKVQGNFLSFLTYAAAGAFTMNLLGAAIATRPQKTETVGGIANVFFFPMMFMSGIYFKTELFPESVQKIARFLPLTALNEGLRAIANEAQPLTNLWPQFLVLGIWSGVCLLITTLFFKWGESDG